jgi:hypothetical protein
LRGIRFLETLLGDGDKSQEGVGSFLGTSAQENCSFGPSFSFLFLEGWVMLGD